MADQDNTADVQPTPSQAEGSEDPGHQPPPKTTPSQAEGDLETVEQDIEDKEGSS